jgi:hypothetical protein
MARHSRRWLIVVLIATGIGVAVFAVLVSRSVRVGEADAIEAQQRFAEALGTLGSKTPLVKMDASGRFVRRPLSGRVDMIAYSPGHNEAARWSEHQRS